MSNNLPLQLIPEVQDITTFRVTNQLVLIKPLVVDVVKTKGGLILDTEGTDMDAIKAGMIQRAVVVSCGQRVSEVKPGMTVFYYKSSLQGGLMIRQGDELYFAIEEYNIKGYLN